MTDTTTPTTRTVRSPAGQSVEVVPDQEWADLTGNSVLAVRRNYTTKMAVFRVLWEKGTVRSPSGQATEALRVAARPYGWSGRTTAGITSMLNESINAPAVKRAINGRRCMAITLEALPEYWHNIITTVAPPRGVQPAAPPRPHPEVPAPEVPARGIGRVLVEPDPAPSASTNGTVDVDVASAVAASLLAQVVAMVNTPPAAVDRSEVDRVTAELNTAQQRVAHLLADNESLRTRYREQGETLRDTVAERDGLRKRLRMAEHNVDAVLNGPNRGAVADAINRELAKVMEARPAGSKGPDDDA